MEQHFNLEKELRGMKPKEVLAFAKEHGARMVDLKFIDLPGVWQHFTVPMSELGEEIFEDGLGFDGSSIRGWQAIHASDMLVIPDAATAVIDPFMQVPTLSLICNIVDPITKEKYSRDPRNVAQKAEEYLKSTGIGDTAFLAPKRSSSSLMTCVLINPINTVIISSIPKRDVGIPVEMKVRTWVTNRVLRKVTSPSLPQIVCKISVRRWSWRWKRLGSAWRPSITKWRLPARVKSTCVSMN